jgi:hypothetical protein
MIRATRKRDPSEAEYVELPHVLLVWTELSVFTVLWLATLVFISMAALWSVLTVMDAKTLRALVAWNAHLAQWLHRHVSPLDPEVGDAGFLVFAFPVAWVSYLWAAKLIGGRTLGQWLVPNRVKVPAGLAWSVWRRVLMGLTCNVYERELDAPRKWRGFHVAGSLCGALIAVYLSLSFAITMLIWPEQR